MESIITCYQEDGLDYEKTEKYDRDGALASFQIWHEETGKQITVSYSASGEVEYTMVAYTNEAGLEISEKYGPDGSLMESCTRDADGNLVE